jgi:hypothetical protein
MILKKNIFYLYFFQNIDILQEFLELFLYQHMFLLIEFQFSGNHMYLIHKDFYGYNVFRVLIQEIIRHFAHF